MKKKLLGLLMVAVMAMPNAKACSGVGCVLMRALAKDPKTVACGVLTLLSAAGVAIPSILAGVRIRKNTKAKKVDYVAIAKQIASKDIKQGLKRLVKEDKTTGIMVAIALACILPTIGFGTGTVISGVKAIKNLGNIDIDEKKLETDDKDKSKTPNLGEKFMAKVTKLTEGSNLVLPDGRTVTENNIDEVDPHDIL